MASTVAIFTTLSDDIDYFYATNGTAAGTYELPVTPNSGYNFNGISALFPVLGQDVLFVDAEDSFSPGTITWQDQIWITNGTPSGTVAISEPHNEATDVIVDGDIASFGNQVLLLYNIVSQAGEPTSIEFLVTGGTVATTSTFAIPGLPLPYQFFPSNFMSFGNLVLFTAENYSGASSLWVSNGTAPGTVPLAVSGAAASGLSPSDITVVGNQAFFVGYDSANQLGLWVTNGTASGTQEIEAPNAFSGGLTPRDLTPFGNSLLFAGLAGVGAAGGGNGLWITNGTSSGTSELIIPGAESGYGPSPSNITVFGTEALFTGIDASDNSSALFVTNGTSAGSYELSWNGSDPEGFFSIGDQVYFEAVDSAGHNGLWVTNGTSAGTFEIAVPNAYALGVFNGLAGTSFEGDFTAVGNDLVFCGENSLAEHGLWVTNGTSSGTTEILPGVAPTAIQALPDTAIVSTNSVPLDFYNNNASAIALQNTDGQMFLLQEAASGGNVGSYGASWSLVGADNFYTDGNTDIVLQDTSGQMYLLDMQGNNVVGGGNVGNYGSAWDVVGTGGFFSDGDQGIALQNTDGQIYLLDLQGNNVGGGDNIGNYGSDWHVAATGDFFGDGNTDLVLQNTDGDIYLLDVHDTVVGGGNVGNFGADWKVVGAGSFLSDGNTDLVLQDTDGQIGLLDLQGSTVVGFTDVGNFGASWQVKEVGDFFGDGHRGVALQNTSGQVYLMELNGGSVSQSANLGNYGSSWHVPILPG